MRLARTFSSLCVACVVIPFIGAGPATQPAAPVNDNEQLRQRIAQLEAEVADLRAKLDRASRPDAIKSALTLTDELKIDYVPAPAREPARLNLTSTGTLLLGGNVTRATTLVSSPATTPVPTNLQFRKHAAGDLIDDRPKPAKP